MSLVGTFYVTVHCDIDSHPWPPGFFLSWAEAREEYSGGTYWGCIYKVVNGVVTALWRGEGDPPETEPAP